MRLGQDEHSFFLQCDAMPRVTEQHLDDPRRQIIEAARHCFLRNGGFHSTSMQDLFAKSDLPSGAVYRNFAGKDGIISAPAKDNICEVTDAKG